MWDLVSLFLKYLRFSLPRLNIKYLRNRLWDLGWTNYVYLSQFWDLSFEIRHYHRKTLYNYIERIISLSIPLLYRPKNISQHYFYFYFYEMIWWTVSWDCVPLHTRRCARLIIIHIYCCFLLINLLFHLVTGRVLVMYASQVHSYGHNTRKW